MPWVPRPNAGPDEFDWVEDEVPQEQAPPASPKGGPPYTLANLPPPPEPGFQWVLNEATGEFEYIPQGASPSNIPPTPTKETGPPFYDPDPAPGGYNGGSGDAVYGGGGAILGGAPAAPQYPTWDAPPRTPVGPFVPRNATFALDPYTASSWSDAENEPGYTASREQLRKQVEAGAAARGMLRSGMTLGNIYTNLDALSQQNFKQFDDRRFRNWGANQTQRLDKFDREYGIDRDIYDRYANEINTGNDYGYRSAVDRNNYNFNVADASARDSLERWKTRVGALTSLARPVE